MTTITSIWIIGYGQFWKFIHTLCKQYFPDTEVYITSRSYEYAVWLEQTCKADIVFPCVPIACFEEQMERIVPLLWKQSIIWEVCTVKVFPLNILKKYDGLRYICSHPMFWPESFAKQWESLTGLKMAWCDDTLWKEHASIIKATLQSEWIDLVSLTADKHDEELASTLFLTHYVSQIICQSWFHRWDIDTVSFGFLMDAVESVKDNEDLFKDVWKYNPYCKSVVEKFAMTNVKILTSLPEVK